MRSVHYRILRLAANQVGNKAVFPSLAVCRQFFLLFLKAAVKYLHVLVAVKQLHKYVDGLLHALAGEPFERTALVRIFFAVDAEETAHGLTERKPGEVDMIFFFEPVGKFLLCPDIPGQLVSLGTHMDVIRGRSVAGKVVRLSVKSKGEENRMVADMLSLCRSRYWKRYS